MVLFGSSKDSLYGFFPLSIDIFHTSAKVLVMDAGYKTPAIAKWLIDDGVKPLFPYKRPMTKAGFLRLIAGMNCII